MFFVFCLFCPLFARITIKDKLKFLNLRLKIEQRWFNPNFSTKPSNRSPFHRQLKHSCPCLSSNTFTELFSIFCWWCSIRWCCFKNFTLRLSHRNSQFTPCKGCTWAWLFSLLFAIGGARMSLSGTGGSVHGVWKCPNVLFSNEAANPRNRSLINLSTGLSWILLTFAIIMRSLSISDNANVLQLSDDLYTGLLIFALSFLFALPKFFQRFCVNKKRVAPIIASLDYLRNSWNASLSLDWPLHMLRAWSGTQGP